MRIPIRYRETILYTCIFLLVLLWSYTAVSKWSAPEEFRTSLTKQPLGIIPIGLAFYGLPATELIAAVLLCIKKTMKLGLYLSLLLMLGFTTYVALTLAGAFGFLPCACGGVIQSMGWKAHLFFNLFFLAVATLGAWTTKNENKRKPPALGASGDRSGCPPHRQR